MSSDIDMAALIEGTAYLLGNHVDADSIIPVRYCTRPAPEVLVKRCLTVVDPDFPIKATRGLILVAGLDFGRGSANENAVRALMLSGVRGVIAKNFGSLFRRNAINLGLPIMECPTLVGVAEAGDKIHLDLVNWHCSDTTAGFETAGRPVSSLEQDILISGGLVNWIKKQPVRTEMPAPKPTPKTTRRIAVSRTRPS